ncbi:DEAD-domain-containing protein [Choiromyces venosus 120613-1]|uniref:ATP-dependent RNA helicase n=1 Tax=Choiromyces venosus 120613-1 TaxID=1336337 RepID=A0A3N4J103_9PEZI|nr:DEAD-domain-containing protein [Choiromyces venosus 120613-1]
MADDGMLVNFDISPDAFTTAIPKFQGGRWKDRLKAKRAVEHRAKKRAIETAEFNIAQTTSTTTSETTTAAVKRKRGDEKPKQKPTSQAVKTGEFVSSLWTRNPEATSAVTGDKEEEKANEPSNAPLADGSATFTTLGLSPILANHLTAKLALKAPTAIQRSAIPELMSTDSDAFIQAETGSGKTLTYLLPIVNRIMSLSAPPPSASQDGESATKQTRHSGLYAIILAPTRELCRQISTVLSTLIHCKNGPHWIVPGAVSGGEKKKSEKARLRKGLNILVATPGRLLDHLQNTESLDVSRVRWVVLDEGDRLMELGFEETIGSILGILEKKSKLPKKGEELAGWKSEAGLPKRRVSMLCSATMKTNVQRLGDISLKEALYIKAEKGEEEVGGASKTGDEGFQAPAQLKQSYVVVPAKLRLVGLNAILKRAFIRQTASPKIIVFFSCSDSVDFHFQVFSRSLEDDSDTESSKPLPKPTSKSTKSSEKDSKKADSSETKPDLSEKPTKQSPQNNPAIAKAPHLHPTALLHKLHGSLPQQIRTSALHSFTHTTSPSILFCTDVAARGLDLPNVDQIIQFDPPFSRDDHLHRIGRTARAGRPGRAIMFILPGAEEGYVDAVLKKCGTPIRADVDEVFKKGFGGEGSNSKKREWEDKATEWQLEIERWVLADKAVMDQAKKAWGSHIRAYTTHVAAEKGMFNHKALHYGHLAKSFGIRDAPGDIRVPGGGSGGGGKGRGKTAGSMGTSAKAGGTKRGLDAENVPGDASQEAVRKMRKIAFSMQMKKGMASEFNIG